jgi:hypothetical protein
MPQKLTVTGLGKLDGEYPFDYVGMQTMGHPEQLTNREGRTIKRMSGVRAGELNDALEAGDTDVLVALAKVIMERAGRYVDEDALWDSPMASALRFEWTADDEEDEGDAEGPPAESSPRPPEPDSNESLSSTSEASGTSSTTGSENPGDVPRATGSLGLVKSAESEPETLAS